MDAKLFRLPTKPNFYASIATASPFDAQQRQKASTLPTQDIRFPGWAAPMSDGRLVTEYMNHCSKNIPVGHQFATREWMTKNADSIIAVGRQRFAEQTGATYGMDLSVVPPPESVINCTRAECHRVQTDLRGGIGVERADVAPELFGTWDPRNGLPAPAPRTAITTKYEGGRNTPRGGFAPSEPEMR